MQIIQFDEKSITLISASIDDTLTLGKTIGKQLSAGHIVALVGDIDHTRQQSHRAECVVGAVCGCFPRVGDTDGSGCALYCPHVAPFG